MCHHPDLNLEPVVIDADQADDLSWVYQAPSTQRPASIDLDDLPIEVDWSKKRMLWMVYGACNLDVIQAVMMRITECSKVVILDSESVGTYGLRTEEKEQLAQLVLAERLSIITGASLMQRVDQLLERIDINLLDGWKPILSKTIIHQRPEEVQKLFARIGAGLNTKIMSKGTYLTVAQQYLRNTLINAPLAAPNGILATWKDALKDRPVLLVSAGPSLNKQLPLLAENQDLFTIIAVDTVWAILKKQGITPDVLFALDPISVPAWEVNTVSHDTAFCIDLGCAPRLMWSHDHNHVISTCDPFTSSIAGALGVQADYLRTGGSVATSAFSLAEVLGANPIVLIGQDLALTHGRDHAEGYAHTYSAAELKVRTDYGFDVEGYYGGQVRTERQLLYYKTWFERRAGELQDRMIINATEGGAKIAGAFHVPFADVCREIRKTSLRKSPLMKPVPTRIESSYLTQLRDGLKDISVSVLDFKALAGEGREICKRVGNRPSKKQMHRLDQINQRIKDHEPRSKMMVNVMGLSKFEIIRYQTHTGEGMHGLGDAVRKYDEVYQQIESGADAALKMLDEMEVFYDKVAERGEVDPALLEHILPS